MSTTLSHAPVQISLSHVVVVFFAMPPSESQKSSVESTTFASRRSIAFFQHWRCWGTLVHGPEREMLEASTTLVDKDRQKQNEACQTQKVQFRYSHLY